MHACCHRRPAEASRIVLFRLLVVSIVAYNVHALTIAPGSKTRSTAHLPKTPTMFVPTSSSNTYFLSARTSCSNTFPPAPSKGQLDIDEEWRLLQKRQRLLFLSPRDEDQETKPVQRKRRRPKSNNSWNVQESSTTLQQEEDETPWITESFASAAKDMGIVSYAAAASSSFASSSARTTTQEKEQKVPTWFPWIPTRVQIQALSRPELEEACRQRNLIKHSKHRKNKSTTTLKQTTAQLEEMLWHWTLQQQKSHTKTLHQAVPQLFPNSIQEWARTVDLDPLLQRRKDIHRDKHKAKKDNLRRSKHNRNSKQQQDASSSPAATLALLTKALEKSTSNTNNNNVHVQECLEAAKQADQLGDVDVAIQILERLATVAPYDSRIYRRWSRGVAQQGNVVGAKVILQQGLRLSPTSPHLWQGLGQWHVQYDKKKSNVKATECFQKAIECDPTLPNPYHAWAILEYSQGNITAALRIVSQGLDYCPKNHRLHHALGDVYRGAKMLSNAERSYQRALEVGPPVSRAFAQSALAKVAYEQGNLATCRSWLQKAVAGNDGRHAQGWLSWSKLEESIGNVPQARSLCMVALSQYERGLLRQNAFYRRQRDMKRAIRDGKTSDAPARGRRPMPPPVSWTNITDEIDSLTPAQVQKRLVERVPRYRSGDRFLLVYRQWAHLEERHGTPETVEEVYTRAMTAFPTDFRLPADFARYQATVAKKVYRARSLYTKACSIAAGRHADPYRWFGTLELNLGNYAQARAIFFTGARAVAARGHGRTQGMAELYCAWAICEWRLGQLRRAETLLDHALQLVPPGGSRLRSYLLYVLARLEYFAGELHLAQHFIGLCLQENAMPRGNTAVWKLWAMVAEEMRDEYLRDECLETAERLASEEFEQMDGDQELKGADLQEWIRSDPWEQQLRMVDKENDDLPIGSQESNFFTSFSIPRRKPLASPE